MLRPAPAVLAAMIVGAAALAATAWPAPAEARRGGRDGEVVAATVTREAAIETARGLGLIRVREVKLRDGLWKVEGWSAEGLDVEVEIDAGSGAVVKHEIYRSRR
ncbi:MAG: PepSY domain-containing protein [Hyphomonadaceae bacterium]|nr:PepSY domain-containing protein [Hyphomonadaceae bacterium]